MHGLETIVAMNQPGFRYEETKPIISKPATSVLLQNARENLNMYRQTLNSEYLELAENALDHLAQE